MLLAEALPALVRGLLGSLRLLPPNSASHRVELEAVLHSALTRCLLLTPASTAIVTAEVGPRTPSGILIFIQEGRVHGRKSLQHVKSEELGISA